MSTIGVKYHNEDIHNILLKVKSPTLKTPKYSAKLILQKKAELTAKFKYNGHQTFGKAHYDQPDFSNYLKKGKAKASPAPVKKPKREPRPPIPKQVKPEKPKQVKKNFVQENIKKLATLEPKLPPPRRVETPRGTVKDLTHLLQMIKIRDSDRYGKIPLYLCMRKQQWMKAEDRREKQREALKKYKEKMGIGIMGMKENVYMLDNDIRKKLLHGLKENWNELFKQFLKLPVMNDTLTKIKRRAWLEKEMDQIEKDIKLIESHPYIYLERTENKTWEQILQEEGELEISEEEKLKREKEKESKEQESKEKEKEKVEFEETKSQKSVENPELLVKEDDLETKSEVKENLEVAEKKDNDEVKIIN